MENNAPITKLPPELLLRSFSHLDPADLYTVEHVSKSWSQLAETQWNGIWGKDALSLIISNLEPAESRSLYTEGKDLVCPYLEKYSVHGKAIRLKSLDVDFGVYQPWQSRQMMEAVAEVSPNLEKVTIKAKPTLYFVVEKGLREIVAQCPKLRKLTMVGDVEFEEDYFSHASLNRYASMEQSFIELIFWVRRVHSIRLVHNCFLTGRFINHIRPAITQLSLIGCTNLNDEALKNIAQRCTRLVCFTLEYSGRYKNRGITDEGFRHFRGSPCTRTLEELKLGGRFDKVTGRALVHLSACKGLKSVQLCGINFRDKSYGIKVILKRCKKLKHMDIKKF